MRHHLYNPGFPFVVPPENFDKHTERELLQATDMAISMKREGIFGKPCPDYTDECVSMKVVRIIQSYVSIVNRMVWRKEI